MVILMFGQDLYKDFIYTSSMFFLKRSYIYFQSAGTLKIITFQELTKREVVNVTHLVIPAELGALLQAAGGE